MKIFLLIVTSLIVTILFTWPLALKITTYFPESSDWALESWILWYSQDSIISGKIFDITAYFTAPQFYPSSFSLAFSEHLLVPSLLFLPLYQLTHNLVLSTNIFVFLTFILSFVASFYFIFHFLKDRTSAFVGALFYTFNPYIAEHLVAGHLQLLNRFFLPLLFLFAIEFFLKPNRKYALLFITFFTLNALSGIYFQNYSVIGLAAVFIVIFVSKHRNNKYQYLKNLITRSLIFVPFFFIIFYFNHLYLQFSYLESAKRGIIDNLKLSARLFDWLFTLPQSWLYGSFVDSWAHFRGADSARSYFFYPERVVFPTIVGATLCLFGILKKPPAYLLTLLAVAALLALGPSIYIYHGFALPNPLFDILYHLGPLLQGTRVPARFILIFYIPFSFLIALGFFHLKKSIPVLLLLVVVVSAWYAENSLTWQWNKTSKSPENFRLNLTNNKKTIHYPLFLDNPRFNTQYLPWSIYNGEILFNGYSGFAPREWTTLAIEIQNPEEEKSRKLLKAIGIDYIVIHEGKKLKFLDLKKLPSVPICSSDPASKIVVTKNNVILKNTEGCYLVAKYQDKYIKLGQRSYRLPIVTSPNSENFLYYQP